MKNELNLKVFIKADGRYGFDRKRVREAVRNLLLEREIRGDVVLSILLVGERKIKELNKKYLGKDEVTDVLSFSQMERKDYMDSRLRGNDVVESGNDVVESGNDEMVLGDVVVCCSVAKKQAVKMNKLLDEEIEFLVLHGVLHLLGVHHD
ncbi:rRNA maturation RNase YbeY [Patescibacteria group bacterium]|nr:rRNA maturation RNase YbeY [Patescibacteria group bacterium]